MTTPSLKDLLATIHPVDLAALVFIVWQSIFGAVRGFAFQFVRLLAWGGGLVLARTFGSQLAEAILGFEVGLTAATASVLAWFTIMFASLLAGLVILRLVRTLIESWKLGGIDRTLGFAFGALKALLIIVVAMILAFAIARPLGFDSYLASSRCAEWSGTIVDATAPALPDDLSKQFQEWIAAAKARATAASIVEIPASPAPR